MRCNSCQADIDPKWSHAINNNICPWCGSAIMEEYLKSLFATLRDTMDKLQAYPEQLNDWMLSNHQFIKTDATDIIKHVSDELLKTHRIFKDKGDVPDQPKKVIKVQTEKGPVEVEVQTLKTDDQASEFFKRANPPGKSGSGKFTSPADKNQHLKDLKAQIEKAGSTGIIVSPEEMAADESDGMSEDDSAAMEDFYAATPGEHIHSAIANSMDDDIPAGILAANQAAAAARGGSSHNAADLLKLQRARDRQQQSRDNFESGANRGGGGFSRSG